MFRLVYNYLLCLLFVSGPKYWKSSARRVRALPENDYNKFVGGVADGFEDDDVDFIPTGKGKAPLSKRYRSGSPELSSLPGPSTHTSLETIVKRLDVLEKRHSDDDELVKAKATINRMQLELSVVSGKLEAIAENLKCMICQGFLSTSDSVVLPCCGNFGCCRPCISPWLTDNATCPHCRAALSIIDVSPFPRTRQIPSIIEVFQPVEVSPVNVMELN